MPHWGLDVMLVSEAGACDLKQVCDDLPLGPINAVVLSFGVTHGGRGVVMMLSAGGPLSAPPSYLHSKEKIMQSARG